jgi:hypothetical protein
MQMLKAVRCSANVRTPLMSLLARTAIIRENPAGTGMSEALCVNAASSSHTKSRCARNSLLQDAQLST